MGERELQPLSGVQSRVKVCCDVLSHQHRGLPASGKLITPVTASKPHPTCLAMPPLKCCYCFCLPTRGKFSPRILGSQGRQEIREPRWRGRPLPLTLLGCSRDLDKKHKPFTAELARICLAWFLSAHISCDQRTGFVPRGQVCLSLWEQCPCWSSVLCLHKAIDWFQPWLPSISSPFTRRCWQWYVVWCHRYTQVRMKRSVNEASFIDPVQCLLMMYWMLGIIRLWCSDLFKTQISRPQKLCFS